MRIVVKIGSSSLTGDDGRIDSAAVHRLCDEVKLLREVGRQVVIVTSGAIAAGLPLLGLTERPKDLVTLQAAASAGQVRLMRAYDKALTGGGVVGAQILLTPQNFLDRPQYLQARDTLERLLSLGAVPLVNENDAVSSDEIGFGDNDRLAALVANAVKADLLVLLTDAPGLFTADPRVDENATLIEQVHQIDDSHAASAGGAGTARGTGGMLSKLTAARMATWSGVPTVIAAAERPHVVVDAVAGDAVGTLFHPHERRLTARKAWIAFAVPARGTVAIDDGAVSALRSGRSLLPAGVTGVTGGFDAGDAVAVMDKSGAVLARGLSRLSAAQATEAAGRRTADLPVHLGGEVVNRDDLVLLTD